jgi:hypothetical protein
VSVSLEQEYLDWLYSQVANPRRGRRVDKYWVLLRILFKKEFLWLIPKDDNRAKDGKDLREEFLVSEGIELDDPDWVHLGCSMLEMLIALSRRLGFETDSDPAPWFWTLMRNVDLERYNDAAEIRHDRIHEILDTVIWRLYHPSGDGGLFPLKKPHQDQREVELWYQLQAYLLERL